MDYLSAGMICRDHEGVVLLAFRRFFPYFAEMLTIIEGSFISNSTWVDSLVDRSDDLPVVQTI